MISIGKPLTTTFVSANVHIPTEKVGCLQVTNQLREFLIYFPPESKEKAFEQIYKSSIYHRHIEHFFHIFGGSTVFSLISESTCRL